MPKENAVSYLVFLPDIRVTLVAQVTLTGCVTFTAAVRTKVFAPWQNKAHPFEESSSHITVERALVRDHHACAGRKVMGRRILWRHLTRRQVRLSEV